MLQGESAIYWARFQNTTSTHKEDVGMYCFVVKVRKSMKICGTTKRLRPPKSIKGEVTSIKNYLPIAMLFAERSQRKMFVINCMGARPTQLFMLEAKRQDTIHRSVYRGSSYNSSCGNIDSDAPLVTCLDGRITRVPFTSALPRTEIDLRCFTTCLIIAWAACV